MNKSHILGEIKRTAVNNGGVPLGRLRFFTETGIKESDWLGKHWVRWSDAVAEAGFGTNEFTTAYDKAELLDKYVCFVLELGRLPVSAEMKMKARNDPEFPSESTFRNRLGPKLQLVEEVAKYARSNAKFEAVIPLCEEYLSRPPEEADESESVSDNSIVGFVYLMKSGRFYKIGKSNSAGRREYELAIQLPDALKTIHCIPTDDPTGIEAYWHNRFKEKRKNGEWFDLTPQDVTAFKRRKFM